MVVQQLLLIQYEKTKHVTCITDSISQYYLFIYTQFIVTCQQKTHPLLTIELKSELDRESRYIYK